MTHAHRILRRRLFRALTLDIDSIMVDGEIGPVCDWIDACEGGWMSEDEVTAVRAALTVAGV